MTTLLRPETIAWLVLLALTILNFAISEGSMAGRFAASLAIILAAFKVRIVFIQFMELHRDVQPWRIIFELWIALVTVMILAGFWLSPA